VVQWIETSIYSIERCEERQYVNSCEYTGEWTIEKIPSRGEISASESVGIRDELDTVSHAGKNTR